MRLRCALCGMDRELRTIPCPVCCGEQLESPYTFQEYQEAADRTSRFGNGQHRPPIERILVATLGLAGEAGEVADIVKKEFGHGHPRNNAKLMDELGDVLWYLAELAASMGITLEQVALLNIAKLRKRYPEGFSSEASLNRKDG